MAKLWRIIKTIMHKKQLSFTTELCGVVEGSRIWQKSHAFWPDLSFPMVIKISVKFF